MSEANKTGRRRMDLSSNQMLVLRGMRDTSHGLFYLRRLYDVSRSALLRKGFIVFNAERGMYEITPAGLAALEASLAQIEAAKAPPTPASN